MSPQHISILCLLAAFLLLPHGIGFDHPFGLPSLDLPRLSVFLLNLVAFSILIIHSTSSKCKEAISSRATSASLSCINWCMAGAGGVVVRVPQGSVDVGISELGDAVGPGIFCQCYESV